MKIIDESLLSRVGKEAQESPRLRKNYNFHQSLDDRCHRFLNALLPGTVIPIHHHPTKDESFILLKGKVRVLTYDDDGNVLEDVVLSQADGRYGVDIPKNTWHTIEVIDNAILFEVKEGPFIPHEQEGILNMKAIKAEHVGIDEIKAILVGMDVPHAELVHALFKFEVEYGSLKWKIEPEDFEKYEDLCYAFFGRQNGFFGRDFESDVSVLPELNDECVKVIDAIQKVIKEKNEPEKYLNYVLNRLRNIAKRPVKTFAIHEDSPYGIITERLEKAKKARMNISVKKSLSPVLHSIMQQIHGGQYEEAAGNLFAVFSSLEIIKDAHHSWFERWHNNETPSEARCMLGIAAEMYCHLRQQENLPEELAEDMDARLAAINEWITFYDWSNDDYADMLRGYGEQYGDHTNIDQFKELQFVF